MGVWPEEEDGCALKAPAAFPCSFPTQPHLRSSFIQPQTPATQDRGQAGQPLWEATASLVSLQPLSLLSAQAWRGSSPREPPLTPAQQSSPSLPGSPPHLCGALSPGAASSGKKLLMPYTPSSIRSRIHPFNTWF